MKKYIWGGIKAAYIRKEMILAISCLNNKSVAEVYAFLQSRLIRQSIQYDFYADEGVGFFPFFSAASKLLHGKNLNHWQSADV